jgi:hypothetical protein
MNNNEQAKYYEETDFSDLIQTNGRKIGGAAKRITLNISEQIYDEANELDSYMRMGYQNVLKTAMTIGLTELYNQVSNHKICKKPADRRAPLKTAKTMRTPKRQTV